MGKELLLDTLPKIIDGSAIRIKQDENEVTFAYNIRREEEHVDFSSKKARDIFNQVRGLYPAPLANSILFDKEIKLVKCSVYQKKYDNSIPGQVVEVVDDGFVVCTVDGSVLITEVKPFGKNNMSAKSFINGIGAKKIIGQVLL